ncbi:MAG: LysM domain-containing protein [Nanoarchaeota archaeon]
MNRLYSSLVGLAALVSGDAAAITCDVSNCESTPPHVFYATPELPEKYVPQTYVVQRGDTLSGIAQKLGGKADHYRVLMDLNGILDAHKLPAGKKLIVPQFWPTEYTGQKTDFEILGLRTTIVSGGDCSLSCGGLTSDL